LAKCYFRGGGGRKKSRSTTLASQGGGFKRNTSTFRRRVCLKTSRFFPTEIIEKRVEIKSYTFWFRKKRKEKGLQAVAVREKAAFHLLPDQGTKKASGVLCLRQKGSGEDKRQKGVCSVIMEKKKTESCPWRRERGRKKSNRS